MSPIQELLAEVFGREGYQFVPPYNKSWKTRQASIGFRKIGRREDFILSLYEMDSNGRVKDRTECVVPSGKFDHDHGEITCGDWTVNLYDLAVASVRVTVDTHEKKTKRMKDMLEGH